jgi:carboxyl-terminal processing protease
MKETHSFIVEAKKRRYAMSKSQVFMNFEGKRQERVCRDTAMEVLKLQKDSIQGVIIDLMDNGGGSMEEMKLAGMFIDSVPSPLY